MAWSTWLGLALLVAAMIVGIFPLLPTATLSGAPMTGVPHVSAWLWSGVALLGVVLLFRGRRASGR